VIQSLFLFIAILGLLAAAGTVLARNLVHAALFLVAYFFLVACVFVLLEAEFLAAIQVLVYIGAIAILMMFGIMLTRNVQGDDTTSVSRGTAIPAVLAMAGLFVLLMFGINNHAGLRRHERTPSAWSQQKIRPPLESTVAAGVQTRKVSRTAAINDMGRVVGLELVNRYALPFEVAGLLLTAALVGAVALAHREAWDETPSRPQKREGSSSARASSTTQTTHS
jgi:NADH:ubiquinone oxidoreductase subunit 6 (subunit J)